MTHDAPPFFTCLMPTRNRAGLIHRAYESLKAQTFRDFEWLVIDNCSTDDTPALIAKWQQEASFPIRYIRRKTDGGLPSSYAMGIREARGQFLIEMRDADSFIPQTLERFKSHWESIPASQRDRFVGVTGNVVDEHGNLVGTRFPAQLFDSDRSETTYRFKVTGEKWGCQRTDVMREYALSVDPAYTGYIPESVMWRKIARRYKTRYVDEAYRVYYQNVSNRQSVSPKPWLSAYGVATDAGDALELDLQWFRYAPLMLTHLALKYVRLSFHLARSPSEQWRRLSRPGAKLLWLVALPAGLLMYLRDDRRRLALGEPRAVDPG